MISTREYLTIKFPPGTHEFTVTASDGRGGSVSDTFTITIDPTREIVMSPIWCCSWPYPVGTWQEIDDPTAAGGRTWHDPDAGRPKRTAPESSPVNFLHLEFVADPTQTYKLWVRSKAQNDSWANDSVFLQFSGATSSSGTPVYRIGTTSSLEVNLEECSGCGLSGWGWRDERWGPTLTSPPVLLHFPQGGTQFLVIQSREDGISIDQIVLSAEQYVTARPGAAKNDTTILR